MINLSKEDKDYTNRTKGNIASRAVSDHLSVLKEKFGEGVEEKMQKEVNDLGYDIDILNVRERKTVPIAFYVTFLVIERELFNLDNEGMRELGRESAKRSFLLRFASNLLISLDMMCKNANTGWRKYYETGEFKVTNFDKEKKEIVGEITNFVGHPDHCRFLEGYFEQLIFFVSGKKGRCREKDCIFIDNGDVHRFIITLE